MNIYIKPKKKASLLNRQEILIGDVADVIAKGDEAKKICQIKLRSLDKGESNYVVSVTDIIKKIASAYPAATINNVGQSDTWVHAVWRKRGGPPLLWLRVAAISLILFFGAATAIMSFHTDGQIPQIFEHWHEIIFGTTRENPPIIAIPYAIGLAAGIIFFYNHFFGKKITDEPTPIEVEMETYEKEVTETVVGRAENPDD